MKRTDLHTYQTKAINFIKKNKKCALFLEMGLGKTVSTLTAIADMYDNFEATRVLIVAPLRVANHVWKQEAKKWDHLKNLKINICTGTPAQRKKALTDYTAQIYVINWENIAWMVKQKLFDFDMVVIDESSKFKSHRSVCFSAMRSQLDKIDSMVLLSGTPSPNSLVDLYSQIYLLDKGERLGKNVTTFRRWYCERDHGLGYTWIVRKGQEDQIKQKIEDICLSMKTEDYLEMPECITIQIDVDLPTQAITAYNELEKQFYTVLEGSELTAVSAGVLAGKLLQFCNGSIYDEQKNVIHIHDEKINALKQIIEENPNENFLLAYNYKHDKVRLQKAFPDARVLDDLCVQEWNDGKIKILLAHPASAGHGLNLQAGGANIVWFGLNWSLELYEQFNARLYRQGQTNTVKLIHIVTKGCMDEKVLKALSNKAKTQNDLMQFLKKSQ